MLRVVLDQLDARINLNPDGVTIAIDHAGPAKLLGCEIVDGNQRETELHHPVTLNRRGHELRLIYTVADDRPPQRDQRLIQLLASGRLAYQELRSKSAKLTANLRNHVMRLAKLQYLAPDIVTAVLEGRQPVELTSRTLLPDERATITLGRAAIAARLYLDRTEKLIGIEGVADGSALLVLASSSANQIQDPKWPIKDAGQIFT